jgi:hypothetical protein
MKDALTILVVGAVTLVWVTVFVASIFTREYLRERADARGRRVRDGRLDHPKGEWRS